MTYNGADLIFPNLGIVIETMQNHITVFGFDIAYYGIIIGIGMLLALFAIDRNVIRHSEDPSIIYDFFIVAIICGILGARIYYVAFEWDNYRGDILKIINIRQGGLAIYGGITAGILSALAFSRIRKYPFLKLTDYCMPGVLVGQCVGRWGNFFNCEAFGGYTESLFAMRMKLSIVNSSMVNDDLLSHLITDGGVSYIQAHPTFLYESCWNLLSFLILWFYAGRHKAGTGDVTLRYFILYGTGRFFIESLRTDSLLIPGTAIAVSQLLSLVLVVVCTAIIIYRARSRTKGI